MIVADLKKLLRANAWFFACFVLFLVVGAILLLVLDKGDAVMYFSNHRSPFGDMFFLYFTRMGEGLLYIVLAVSFLFIRFRTAIYLPMIGISVMIVSNITKRIFANPRPWLYYNDLGLVDQIIPVAGAPLLGGANSFPSGHTMSAFAMYTFLALVLPRKNGWGILLFTIALLVGVSRIYLVVHFLEDVYLGAIMGVLIAVVFYYLHSKYPKQAWADQSLLTVRKKFPQP